MLTFLCLQNRANKRMTMRKYRKSRIVLVQLRKMNTHILLVVGDNGCNLTEEKTNGIGLSNLRSRGN